MVPLTLPLPLEGGGLGRGWTRRRRWKNGSVKSAVTFMIRKRAIPMEMFLPIPPSQKYPTIGSAQHAAPRKRCSKKFSEIQNS